MRGTITFLTLCTALAALAQVPCKWTVDLARVTPADWDCLRGETVELMPSFVSGRDVRDLSGVESATLWWQTNGMGAAYWSAPASVDTNSRPHRLVARWTPEMDCGAAAYRYFVGAAAPSGTQYRAHGTIRMRGAPGDLPNALPLPVPLLDFARVNVTNEPWTTGGTVDAYTRAEADEMLAVKIGTNGTWEAGSDFKLGFGGGMGIEPARQYGVDLGTAVNGVLLMANGFDNLLDDDYESLSTKLDSKASASDLGSAAYRDAGDFATAADEQLLYQLVMGSNVVFEVTNYNSRVRAPAMRLQRLDPDTREYYTVWAETNGLARTLAAANGYTDAASNALDRAKADRAWSRHTSGLGADAPEGVTWVSTPETVIAGGYEYTRTVTTHGEVWVLASNGLAMGGDTNAFFTVSSGDGEPLFSIEKTDAVLVGVDAAGITVSDGLVSVPLDVVSEAQPECYACTDLANPQWVKLTDGLPGWVTSAQCTGASGAWVWQIETDAPRAFFQFRVLQPGGTVIRHHAQTDLSQGILIGNRRYIPVVTGNTLTWEAAN